MRFLKMSRLASISLSGTLACLIGIAAAAQTSSPPSGGVQPEAAPPAQTTPQAEPSSPATSGPSQSSPAGMQSGPSSSGAGAPSAQSSGPSIDQELQLTDDQKQKIAAVVDDENKQIASVRDDNSMSLEQKQQKVLQIRQAGTPKIKSILTPEQLQKLASIQQRMKDQQGGQQAPGQGNTPQSTSPRP